MSLRGKIGITGATSFLGRRLARALRERGHEVDRFAGDICNPSEVSEFVERCDIIYHLAGVNRGEPNHVLATNALGGANIAAACSAFQRRSVVFASSSYLARFPDSPYSIGKRSTEELLANMAGRRGCRATILRLSNTYGPGCLPFNVSVVATFCWFKAHGRDAEMPIEGDGSDVRAFVPIDDVLNALIAAASDDEQYRLVEVSGTLLSVKRLAEIVREPVAWREYPSIGDQVRFFEQALPMSCVMAPRHGWGPPSPDELLPVPAFSRSKQIGIDSVRSAIGWSAGRAALDVYSLLGDYLQTVLMDASTKSFYELSPGYEFRIRCVGGDSATVRLVTMPPRAVGDAQ